MENEAQSKLNEIEKALEFLGEGFYVILDSDGNGFGEFKVKRWPNVIYGEGNIRRQSYTDAFLEAVKQARKAKKRSR